MGKLEKIWIKRFKRGPMDPVFSAVLFKNKGIKNNADQNGKRQVTIIEREKWKSMIKQLKCDLDPSARRANLMGQIDNFTLFRCVQIVRRLAERDRRVGVFCNIAASSLEDSTFFPLFLEFMTENRDLSGAVIFEIRADRFETRSRTMRDNMDKLTELGFRFSIDHAPDLGLDLPRLQSAGVRFVKMNGAALIDQLRDPAGPRPVSSINRRVDGEEVSAVFSRYGITMVAEKMEDEASVVEILEYEIPYGQGHVFGAPRPIKASLMEETAPPREMVQRLTNFG